MLKDLKENMNIVSKEVNIYELCPEKVQALSI